ncbi:MAG: hypothetical protein ACTMHL_07315 [Janibacter sp.]
MKTTPFNTGLGREAEDLPDLGPLLDTDEAREALQAVLEEFEAADGPYHVGSLTDEELVVCTGSLDGAQPTGSWYPELGEHPQRIARTSAYRSLTSREDVLVTMRGEDVDIRVSQRLLALLRLRHGPALLTVQTVTRQGPGWYVLRHFEGMWLREVVTGHGMHSHDLVHLNETEEFFFRGFTFLLDHVTASGVAGLHQPAGSVPGEVVSFLAKQRHLSQVALVHQDSDVPETFVLCADDSGAITVGDTADGSVTYRGAGPESVLRRYRAWRDGWSSQIEGVDG